MFQHALPGANPKSFYIDHFYFNIIAVEVLYCTILMSTLTIQAGQKKN
jgi:hypothetical protein